VIRVLTKVPICSAASTDLPVVASLPTLWRRTIRTSSKFGLPKMAATACMMMPSVKTLITAATAAPRITATASSIMLPVAMNSLNSFRKFLKACLLRRVQPAASQVKQIWPG
jgi:hypothetical protein